MGPLWHVQSYLLYIFQDISAMKEGDLTMVGDKGSTLSGGQKARISLAR